MVPARTVRIIQSLRGHRAAGSWKHGSAPPVLTARPGTAGAGASTSLPRGKATAPAPCADRAASGEVQ